MPTICFQVSNDWSIEITRAMVGAGYNDIGEWVRDVVGKALARANVPDVPKSEPKPTPKAVGKKVKA